MSSATKGITSLSASAKAALWSAMRAYEDLPDQWPCSTRGCTSVISKAVGGSICRTCMLGARMTSIRSLLIDLGKCRESTFAPTFERSMPQLEAGPVYAHARLWSPGDYNPYIHGPAGTGKTFLARCFLNSAIWHWLQRLDEWVSPETDDSDVNLAMEIDGPELYRRLDQGYKTESAEWMARPKYLVVDDLDKGAPTERSLSGLLHAMSIRYDNGMTTIVTSNMPEAGLVSWMEKLVPQNRSAPVAIMDRLRPSKPIEMTGDSKRRLKKPVEPPKQTEIQV